MDAAAIQVLRQYTLANLDSACAKIDGILADQDPECLHDYRVALRRIRAVVSLLKGVYDEATTEQLKSQLRELAQQTNNLRDLDVWLLDTERYSTMLPEELQPGFELLVDSLALERSASLIVLQNYLRSPRQQQLLASIRTLLQKTDSAQTGANAALAAAWVARKVWRKHSKRIARLCSKAQGELADDEIHRIRIGCKQLRYLADMFQPVAEPERWIGVNQQLKSLQDRLGRFNDLCVQKAFLYTRVEQLSEANQLQPQALLAVGGLLGLLQQQYSEGRQQVLAALSDFATQRHQLRAKALWAATPGNG